MIRNLLRISSHSFFSLCVRFFSMRSSNEVLYNFLNFFRTENTESENIAMVINFMISFLVASQHQVQSLSEHLPSSYCCSESRSPHFGCPKKSETSPLHQGRKMMTEEKEKNVGIVAFFNTSSTGLDVSSLVVRERREDEETRQRRNVELDGDVEGKRTESE